MNKVFIYGTLKQNRGNSWLMTDAKYLGECTTVGNYSLYVQGLPFLVEGEGPTVKGELYEVNDFVMNYLDKFEGHPNFYKRSPITVLKNNKKVKAETYIYQGVIPIGIDATEEF